MKKLNGVILALLAGLVPAANALAQDKPEHSHSAHQHQEQHDSSQLIGQPGDPAGVSRSVNVDMNDSMRFAPGSIAVKAGEVIRFVVRNSGKVKHEMVIGTAAELKEHAQAMAKFPNMEHAEPNQVALEPGKTGTIVWQFDKAGKVDFACLQPGHFEAGMKGQVVVSP
jgi:uncharacterized cupredoxin-like copper-binding protein